jgi:Tfp pilus assembly protein PilN
VSLDALVIVFQHKKDVYMLLYPSVLLAVAVFAVIGLGIFQWLTRHAEETTKDSQDDH